MVLQGINRFKLKDLREKLKMSQQELADILHIDRTAITKWENGVTSPKTPMLPQLAKALECTIQDLF